MNYKTTRNFMYFVVTIIYMVQICLIISLRLSFHLHVVARRDMCF